jgi:hypothetical protein
MRGNKRGSSPQAQFSQLVDMYSPEAVLEEIKGVFIASYPVAEFAPVRGAFADFLRLYAGRYPGYGPCSTHYHDKMHVTDATLAMARLFDGYNRSHRRLPVRSARLGLLAAIFHDAGFIQTTRDMRGTGAKYTLTHVERSVRFVEKYFKKHGLPAGDAAAVKSMILCTEMGLPVEKIKFARREDRLAGLMLGAADLLGQMASRCYLERLIFLYREFREGGVKGYGSELELLRKTLDFSSFIQKRLEGPLEGVGSYARAHFKARYGIDRDLYREAMRGQLHYLRHTVLKHPEDYRKLLRRAR